MAVHLRVRQQIEAPPDRVFAALTDLHAAGRWLPGCSRIEMLTPQPYAKGTRWRETRRAPAGDTTEEFEVTGIEPDRAIELHCDGRNGSSGNVDYYFRYDLEPEGRGTLLKLDGRIEPAGWLGRIMAPLMKGAFQKALDRDHAALKAHVEKNAAT